MRQMMQKLPFAKAISTLGVPEPDNYIA